MKRDVSALAEGIHDLLVIGGGIHGAAVAWDAAQRGLRVALVESDDFGAKTSWNSLKTIHGGFRYLQKADLRRLRTSVQERAALLRIAPGIVKPLPFVIPTPSPRLRALFSLALPAYALLSLDRNRDVPVPNQVPPGRLLSRDETLSLFPALGKLADGGGALWTDAQVTHSERLLIGMLEAASAMGARLANRAHVRGLLVSGSVVSGARVEDRESGRELEVRARVTVNAAGPGMDEVLSLAGLPRPPVPLLSASNLVLRRALVGAHALGAAVEGRYLFLVPWRDRSMVGTAYGLPRGSAEDEARLLLRDATRAFPWAELTSEDVEIVHRGLVPGEGGAAGLRTNTLLLDHARDGRAGLVSVQGVKYTTARAVAERTVNLVVRLLGKAVGPCRTATTPLPWARPLEGPFPDRVRHAAQEEMALHLGDVLLRRLDLGRLPSPEEVEGALGVLSPLLGWNKERVEREREGLGAPPILGRSIE